MTAAFLDAIHVRARGPKKENNINQPLMVIEFMIGYVCRK